MTVSIRPVAASAFLLFALTTFPCRADNDRIGPSFACPRPAPADGLSQMICDNPDMSREEMVFEQAYYALRQANGRQGWKALKAEAIAFNTALRTHCGIPLAGTADQTMPSGAAACYISQTQTDRDAWLQRLTGAAREEASRPIEQHVALQQRLLDLGYLPPGTKADGIYGETTRRAIQAWQDASGRQQTAGFLSDDDAAALSTSTVQASAQAATARADAPSILHTGAVVFACINPRATRALGNKADARQSNPGWVAFVRSDGRCFAVSPDQGWEQISEQDGLLLLRRTPPVAGEPPLFFMADDIQRQAPAAPSPSTASAPPAALVQQEAPQPVPDVASGTTQAGPEPNPDAAPTESQASVQDAAPSASPGQDIQTTATPSSQQSNGAGEVIFILALGVAAGAFMAVAYRKRKKASRRIARATEIAITEITVQQQPLRVRKLQLVAVDAYGTVDLSRWVKEKEMFVRTRIAPLLAAEGLTEEWPTIAGYVDQRIEVAASAPVGMDQPSFFSDPEVFDPRMAPTDYELHCALLLRSVGWDAKTTKASGDQGTDVVAQRGGVKLVLQCKLYSRPVGNDAVQEISAARLHQRADYAAVVSNAAYTAAAQQLARTNGVFLLHHEELQGFDPEKRLRTNVR